MSVHPTPANPNQSIETVLDMLAKYLTACLASAVREIEKYRNNPTTTEHLVQAQQLLEQQIQDKLPFTQVNLDTWEELYSRFEAAAHAYPAPLAMAIELIFATAVIGQVDDNHHLRRFIDKSMANKKVSSSEHVLLETAMFYLRTFMAERERSLSDGSV